MLKAVENELRRISWLVYDFGSIGCRELHRPNAEDWADTVHDLRRLRRDLHTSADQNAKLTADLDTLKQTVRDASTFAKSLMDDMRQMTSRGSATMAVNRKDVDLADLLPPGNWAMPCKTEIEPGDVELELEILMAMTGAERVLAVDNGSECS